MYGASVEASYITFRDRASWEAAANFNGLNIFTEDFSNPPNYITDSPTSHTDPTANFSLLGTTWNILSGVHDPVEQNIVQSGAYDIGVSFVEQLADEVLFGLAYETPNSGSTIQIRDSDGNVFHNRYSCCQIGYDPGFYGILSTVSLDLFPADNRTISIDGPIFSRIDNFSIAVASVPEPSSFMLLGIGLLGFVVSRVKVNK